MRCVALALLAGCFSPHPVAGLACPDNWCPPPMQCIAGVCGGGSDVTGPPDASFSEANYMFVTSGTWTPRDHESNFVGAADAFCNMAGAMLRSGTYMAWLDTPTSLAADRISATGARGWIRPDGEVFADTVDDIVNGKLYYPPRVDELRDDTIAKGNFTPVATAVPPSCSTGTVRVGYADATAPDWLGTVTMTGCTSNDALYCFEVDRNAPVSSGLDRSKRMAFVTSNTYALKAPNINQGIDDLDLACQNEGALLDTSRTYLALVAQTIATARSRFDTTSQKPWALPNGVIVATDLVQLLAPIDVTPMGDHVPGNAFFGATGLDTDALSSTNCTNWTSTSGSTPLGTTTRSTSAALTSGAPAMCTAQAHIYCLEH